MEAENNKLTDAELDAFARQLEKDMRAEAAERLAIIKPNNPELAERFRQDGTVYLQDFSFPVETERRLRRANAAEMQAVHYMENEQGNLPYFIVKSELVQTYQFVYDFLYVSYDKRNWPKERYALEKRQRQQYGSPYREPEVFEIKTQLLTENDDELVKALFKSFTTLKIDLD